MLKKTISYTDFNGNKRTEDFYFNLTKAEIAEMEMSISGGLAEMIQNIIKQDDVPSIIKIFKELILKSYGVKSLDGKRFEKTDELRKEFESTEAYSELFMELATNAEEGAKFINGIMPSDLIKEMANNEEYTKMMSEINQPSSPFVLSTDV